MANVIKNGRFITDSWLSLADDTLLPAQGDVLFSLSRWQQDRAVLLNHAGRLGLRLENTLAVSEIAADAGHFELITLNFPKFSDGRAYSQARQLRENYAYRHEIRAVGDVLADQLLFMQRCGFDAFQVREDQSAEDCLAALGAFSVFYQAAPAGTPVP